MKTRKIVLCVVIILLSGNLVAQEAFVSTKLQKVWETPEGLDIPESSYYNSSDHIIYVSNIVGKHNVKDGIGFISKLNIDGEFVEKQWVKGLNAPKGIGISNGKLYVTDIDEVVEVDLKSGEILKKYKSSIAHNFNDITTDKEGNVYVTEMDNHMIMVVGRDSLEVFAESDKISKVNGICDYKNELLLGSDGNLLAIDKKTKAFRIVAEKTGYLDGIVLVDENKVITSDWKGFVQLIEPGKGLEKLIDTTPIKVHAADLGFIPSKNILLVPTFITNKVIAYKLVF